MNKREAVAGGIKANEGEGLEESGRKNRIVMRIGRAATTEQHEIFRANILNAMLHSGLDTDCVAHRHFKALITQVHEATSLGNVVQLFCD